MSNHNPTVDQAGKGSSRPMEDNLKSRDTWLRLVFMLVYAAIISVASIVATAIVVLGFLVVLFSGERNRQLMDAGHAVAEYFRQVLAYLTYNSEEKPFPFGADFPHVDRSN